jgi:hypothetical protein
MRWRCDLFENRTCFPRADVDPLADSAATSAKRGNFLGHRVNALKAGQNHDASAIEFFAHANGPRAEEWDSSVITAGLAAGKTNRRHAKIGQRHAH